MLLIFFTALPLQSKPYNILDGESPYTLPQFSVEPRIMIGYETGYIPDAFVRPWLDLGLFSWFTVGGGIYYTRFLDQKENRFTEWEIRGKIRLLNLSYGRKQLFGYVKYRESKETLIIPYTGPLYDVLSVISPRADGGWDLNAGFSGRLLFSLFSQNFGIFAAGDYTWTGGREYVPEEPGYQNRFFGLVMPVYYINFFPRRMIKKDTLFLAVQNRFTYWFDRGHMYNVMPQLSWEFYKNVVLSAGACIPVKKREDYRYLAEISARFDFSTISADIEADPDDDFTPDGNNVNDVLYIKPSINSIENIREWKITVTDRKRVIKTFQGKGKPPEKIAWNGKSDNDELVESFREYDLAISAVDVKGNRDTDDTSFTVGLILEKIPNGYKIVISNIEFDTARDVIKRRAYPILNKLADYLDDQYSDYNIKIEGHTDNVGGTESNQNLSVRRAKSVMRYLDRKGIEKERMNYAGYGESVPIADNKSDEGRARNRRVEFILQKKGR